jgi:hypothetical protein
VTPWLATATGYCLDTIAANPAPSAYELMFAVRFRDAASRFAAKVPQQPYRYT